MDAIVACAAAVAVVAAASLSAVGAQGPAPASADAVTLLDSVGERLESYYERLTTIVCTETVRQQELKTDMKPRGKAREFVYDLIVTREPATALDSHPRVKAERQIRSRNGKAVKGGETPACTDPQPTYTDPLTFLMKENRAGYRFTPIVGPSLVLQFAQVDAPQVKVFWKDDCFSADGGRVEGQLLIDPATRDIVQLQQHLAEPFDIPRRKAPTVPLMFPFHTVEKLETTVKFRRVPFTDPEEVLLLPESIESVQIVSHADIPRLKTTQRFTNFRRFVTRGKIVK
jgi:hypothetical protein